MDLVVAVYQLTKCYPYSELYGLTSQTRRAAISIPANVAEGRRRGSKREFRHFLTIAYGSGAELETQIEIAKRLYDKTNINFSTVDSLLGEVMRMLNSLISKLQATT